MVMSPSGPRPFHRLFEEQVERALERQLAAEKRGPAAESPVFQRAHGIIKEKKQKTKTEACRVCIGVERVSAVL